MVSGRTLVTFFAVELETQHFPAPFHRGHPGTVLPGWVVAHVLVVTAGQLRHPVVFFIPMITGNGLPHGVKPPVLRAPIDGAVNIIPQRDAANFHCG